MNNRNVNRTYRLRKNSSGVERFTSYIQQRINHGVTNTSKIHREIEENGYRGSLASVYRFIERLKDTEIIKKTRRIIPRETAPGEEAQVDWGTFGKITINGIREPLYAFSYVQSYSRMKYVEFTIRQNEQTLQNCHIHAFELLGIPQKILYDNMKTVVLKRDRKNNLEPKYNPNFQAFAKHYGFDIALAHPYWPQDKGKVEAVIKLIRYDFMNGQKFGKDFSSLEDLNDKVRYWLDTKANKKIHATTKEIPSIRFEKERNYLRFPTAGRVYETSLWSTRHVTKYSMVQYKYNSYSVPLKFARKEVIVNERSEGGVEKLDIYFKSELIAHHTLVMGRNRWIQQEDHFKKSLKAKKVSKRLQQENNRLLRMNFYDKPLTYYDQYLKR